MILAVIKCWLGLLPQNCLKYQKYLAFAKFVPPNFIYPTILETWYQWKLILTFDPQKSFYPLNFLSMKLSTNKERKLKCCEFYKLSMVFKIRCFSIKMKKFYGDVKLYTYCVKRYLPRNYWTNTQFKSIVKYMRY